MNEQYPTSLAELDERIELERNKLLALVDNLPPQERDEIRDPAGWSAKDHMAHLSMWERSMVYLLSGRPRHDGLGVDRETYLRHDYDQTNDAIYREHRDRPWGFLRVQFDEVHGEMIDTLRQVGWDGLHLTYSHYAPDEPGDDSGEPVIYWVAGNTFLHYDMHRGWIEELLAAGRAERSS